MDQALELSNEINLMRLNNHPRVHELTRILDFPRQKLGCNEVNVRNELEIPRTHVVASA